MCACVCVCLRLLLTEWHASCDTSRQDWDLVWKIDIIQTQQFEMTTSASIGRPCKPWAENDNVEIPIARFESASQARIWWGNRALRLSNQRQIKTVHGWLLKVSMRTCVSPSLPAEWKYKLLGGKWRRLGRRHKPSERWLHEMEKIRLLLCTIYYMYESHLMMMFKLYSSYENPSNAKSSVLQTMSEIWSYIVQ